MLVGPEFDGVVREVKDILVMAESAACSAEESTSRLRFDGLQGIAKGVDGGSYETRIWQRHGVYVHELLLKGALCRREQ